MYTPQFSPIVLAAALLGAQREASTDGPSSTAEQRQAFASMAAESYRFRLSAQARSAVKLHPEPLLRWNNKVVREDDGMLFLWIEGLKGRPVAAAQFFLIDRDWHHEFQSLSQSRFEVMSDKKGDSGWRWQPATPGVDLVMADDIDPPAETAPQRLRQMKSLAERFAAAVDQDDQFRHPEELRLLVTPIYRYGAVDQGVLDGALFAFAQGTNPEILVQVEADATDASAKSWRYGFARMSCFNLRVRRGDQVIWKADREPVPTLDRRSAYYFRMKAQGDESANLDVPTNRPKDE
jgi:hypothetical protein